MKKMLVLMVLLALTGVASAAILNNPETFEAPDFADGNLRLQNGWGTWASGNDGYWGVNHATVSGGAVTISQLAGTWWSNNEIFNHGNEIAALPVNGGTGAVQIDLDVVTGIHNNPAWGGDGYVKFQFYADLDHTIAVGDVITIGGQAWASGVSYSYEAVVPAGANYLTPVIATYTADVTIDNVALSQVVPEPMTVAILGLGGLFLRRRK